MMKYICLFALMVAVANAEPACAYKKALSVTGGVAAADCECPTSTVITVANQAGKYCTASNGQLLDTPVDCVQNFIAMATTGCSVKKTLKLSLICDQNQYVGVATADLAVDTPCIDKPGDCTANDSTALTGDCLYTKDDVKSAICVTGKYYYGDACNAAAKSGTTTGTTTSTSSAAAMGLNAVAFATLVNLL
jgi:hypothetical protein